MNNINSQSNYKPNNLLDYYNGRSLNDDFLHRVQKQGESIIKILSQNDFPKELKDAIFIFEINKFNDDLFEMISLSSKYCVARDNFYSKKKQCTEFFEKIDSKDLISRIRKFYEVAWNYDEHFEMRSFYQKFKPSIDGEFSIYPNISYHNIDLSFSENKSNIENIKNANLFLEKFDNFFKNFINVLYGDGEEGEKFVKNEFNVISKEYKYLKETNNEINKQLAIDFNEKEFTQNECHRKIEIIFGKYPATIYKAIDAFLNFSEKIR